MHRAEPLAGGGWVIVGRGSRSIVELVELTAAGERIASMSVAESELPAAIRAREAAAPPPRWVWSDTARWYPAVLAAGVRVARAHDLRLSHAILRDSARVAAAPELRAATAWDAASVDLAGVAPREALFDLDDDRGAPAAPDDVDSAVTEWAHQRAAIAASDDPGRMRLLVAAESVGALIAAELRAAGVPWDAAAHDRLLTETLGDRSPGALPSNLVAAAARVRAELNDPALSLDSQPKLLRGLHRAGIMVESTSRWELEEHDHPAIAPLLEYKKLARLLSANGWSWLEEWVHDGRFRPVYVPGGVVTGRWASSGGGALQLPRQLRVAVRADPGWKLVVADVAQLEPRVLAAMSADVAMADAARGRDLYDGVVDSGAVTTRAEAKIAVLGAMYGATTGDSGRLVPRLRRVYPRAMALVDDAARAGEQGGVVTTWLGRSSPPASAAWQAAQRGASDSGAQAADERRARQWARDRGRFTRNFVVQGTAAEWSLCWLAELRRGLDALPAVEESASAPRSGAALGSRAHLAFFLHDEVIIHAPVALAEAAASAVREAASAAGRLLFGGFPVDFPLDLRIADTADKP